VNAIATADVGPLEWRRVRAGLYEADAGRFGKFVAERMPSGRWYPTVVPGGDCLGCYRTLKEAQGRAARRLVRRAAAAPRTLLEWGVAILHRVCPRWSEDLYHYAIRCPDCPNWFSAAGITRAELSGGDRDFPAGPICLALRRVWDAAWVPQCHLAVIARDCIADPSLLGVLADAAQDAGNPTLEEAARSVAAAIESLRAREG
jgi:hypothetical protein